MFSPFKSFGFEYQWNGGEYSFSVLAESEDEARSRVDAMGESRFCGEVKEELPRVFELAEGTRVQIDGLPYFVKGRAEVAGFVKPNSLACEARYGELSATNADDQPRLRE